VQGGLDLRKTRVVIGTVISAGVFVALPLVYAVISRALDVVLGLPEEPIQWPANLLLTGVVWTWGLFWILWAYSALVFIGQGSPSEIFGYALEPTKQLVITGPYAYVRNPMVFGLQFIFLGAAFLVNSVAGVALLPVAALISAGYIRFFEEKTLVKRFGIEYEHYREHVPMLIPNVVPYVPD